MAEIIKRTELTAGDVARTRDIVMAGGLYFIIPQDKFRYYDNQPDTIEVPEGTEEFYGPFLLSQDSKPARIGVDLVHPLPFIVNASELGLSRPELSRLERGLVKLTHLPSQLLKEESIRRFFRNYASQEDKIDLELDLFDPNQEQISSATLMRADLLLTPAGRALSCDPNLVPLGYAISASLANELERQTGLSVGPTKDYLDGLGQVLAMHPDRISGILTTLSYPNWPSHRTMSEMVRGSTGAHFYVIPSDCLTRAGTLNLTKLNEFNHAFGIPEISPNASNVPGVIIRHVREKTNFKPETFVVNAPGIRLLESQIWPGLFTLPGFEEIAAQSGISREDLNEAREVSVPTLLAQATRNGVQIATSINTKGKEIELGWEDIHRRPDVLVGALWAIGCEEKPKELSWFVKRLATSGKKGVRFTNDGRIDQTEKNILKTVDRMGLQRGKIFLVQPKIRSTVNGANGEELRAKVDLYLSFHTGSTVLIDYMATPISQRAAHGGAATRLGLVVK